MPSQKTFRKSLVALAVAGAFGLGAIAADRNGAAPAANAAPAAAPVAAATPGATIALPDFADMVAKHGPAVVEVTTSRAMRKTANRGNRGMPDMDQLPPWFRNLPRPDMPDQGPSRGMGSGFVVASDGVILTNAHVVADADEVLVKLQDGREFTAKVLGSDKMTDVAVLKIEAKNLQAVTTGNPAQTRVGEWVVAIGAPYGLETTVTSGIVSAKSRTLPGDSVVGFIQTDAAVNPGNSGGPLFNLDGEVIGINSQIFSRSGGFQGLAFAIPINTAMNVKDQIVANGKVQHGKLGITVQEVNQALSESFGMKQPGGALVGTVQKDGPGAKAGLEPGDVITGFDGQEIRRSGELPQLVSQIAPGKKVKLEIWRDGKARELTATIGEREPAKVATAEKPEASQGKLGLVVRPLTSEEKKESKLERGLVVEDVGGPAERAGVRPGDVILSVNRTPVDSLEQMKSLIDKSGKGVALLIQRDDARIFVPVPLG